MKNERHSNATKWLNRARKLLEAYCSNLATARYNLLISKYMFERFKELGIPVAITREDDITLSPTERVNNILSKFGDSNDVIVISNRVNSGGQVRKMNYN